MRLTILNRVISSLLLVAILGMGSSVYWGVQKLQQSFSLNQEYFQLVEDISIKYHSLISSYLDTGNLTALDTAKSYLNKDIPNSLQRMPPAIQQALQPHIEKLQANMELRLLNAGKLAGDIQKLITQNEIETLKVVESLYEYIEAGKTPQNTAIANNLNQLLRQKNLFYLVFFFSSYALLNYVE